MKTCSVQGSRLRQTTGYGGQAVFSVPRSSLAMLVAAGLICAGSAPVGWSAEHPTGTTKSDVTLEDVAKHIEAHVKEQSKDGAFKIKDEKANKELSLTLDKVHRERLSQVAPDMFFVCADFKGADGKLYDLDFFVQGTSKDNLKVVDGKTPVHKEDGKERYTWMLNKEKNVWEQKPAGTKAKEHPKTEHPEHPK